MFRWFMLASLQTHCQLKTFLTAIVLACILASLYLYQEWIIGSTMSAFHPYWKSSQRELPARDVKAKPFILSRTADVYMYSAFVYLPGEIDEKPGPNATDIIITTLDKSRAQIHCCILFRDKKTLQVANTKRYYSHRNDKEVYNAHQFICRVTASPDSLRGAYITLSSINCSTDIQDYLPILHPTRVPGGLALCGKIVYGGGLDPEKVIEWFEFQRLLGVDKILIYDLGNPESLNRVFRYYQNLGVLDLQPYELPGEPHERTLVGIWYNKEQNTHDSNMPIFDCRQRLAGYDYIIGTDLDEFIITRKDIPLKDFLKEQLHQVPKAAGFFFYTQFFMTDWEPTNSEEDLMVKRYRKAMEPRWECYKYVYLPSRVKSADTHHIYPFDPQFPSPRLSPDVAVLHHYRRCDNVNWGNCSMKTMTVNTMTRYHDLDERVARVRTATSTKPQ